MPIMIYKGYEIESTAKHLADDTGWSVSVRIYVNGDSHSNGKIFQPSEKHINQEEAFKHGLILGQRIIDGVLEDYSIDDL